jgi:hypothetical protein
MRGTSMTTPDSTSDRSAPVVSAETAGLGNRLKSWVSAMRLSPDARVHWPRTEIMPATFGDLFENRCEVEGVPAGAEVYASWRLAILPSDERFLPAGFATAGGGGHPLVRGIGRAWWVATGRRTDRYRYMLFPKTHSRRYSRADARHIDLEYERIPRHFIDVYAPLFERIRVRPAITERVGDWAGRALREPVIGVQVRTWRDSPHRYRKYHKPALRRLMRLMDAAPADSRFFLVSDSDEVAPQLEERYGAARVLQYDRSTERSRSWQTPEGTVEDLIDMLLLARVPTLFASYLSTFSEAAWWLGGARASVTVF